MSSYCTALVLAVIFTASSCSSEFENVYDASTLELVHVIFRHGNRSVDANQSYPKDPYINATYFPFGPGQLTNKGKRKEYQLGKALRLRYNDFLGPLYLPEIIDPVSTEYNRTKMSIEVVLAGLFPPKGTGMEWEKELNWQPIPYNYLSGESGSHLLSVPLQYCSKYVKLYLELLSSPAGLALNRRYAKLYNYLSNHTGSEITSLFDVLLLYVTLVAQDDWGFELPQWTEKVYPSILDKASGDFYYSSSSTPELKQLSGGFLLKKIIEDTNAKIQQKLNPPDRKMFMYSAHDMNVAYILSAMNVFYPHEPTYAAYVLVEVHKINGVHGIKVYYQNYKKREPVLMRVPGCGDFCPFDRFVQLLQRNLPSGDDPCEDNKRDAQRYIFTNRSIYL